MGVRNGWAAALAASLIVLGAACGPRQIAPLPPGPGLLTVVAWNLDAGQGDLPRLLADLDAGRLTARPAPATLLLLQEVIDAGEHDVVAIAAARGWTAFFAPVRATDAGTIGNAILSSTPLTGSRRVPLPQERQPRVAAVAEIAIGGTPLTVVSVHLENRVSWWTGGLLSDTARGRQAEAVIAAFPADRPAILGGDLNTWLGPQEPAWRAMAARFPDTPVQDGPTFRDRLVLDHLFFDLPPAWRAAARVSPDAYGSDHHPVVGLVVGLFVGPIVGPDSR